jgi:hypothetical protein
VVGGTFVPFVSTTGDGTTSVTSSTSSVCTVSSGTVSYIGVGNCSLTAQVAAGTNYGSASGSAQGFGVGPSLHAITSPDSVSTMVGSDLSFNVITSGAPVPAIGVKGKLPKTFSFVNNGNGTATLTGTPTKRGVYGFTIKATFGRGKTKYVVTQAFSLIVDAA